jgi:hypothetical protein
VTACSILPLPTRRPPTTNVSTSQENDGKRVLKVLLGSDQPAFVAAAAGVSIAWGNLVAFHWTYLSTLPIPPVWQTIGAGVAMGVFMRPWFFIAVSRACNNMSPWEALAMLSAVILFPLALLRMKELGINPILTIGGSIADIAAAFLTARVIVKVHRACASVAAQPLKAGKVQ